MRPAAGDDEILGPWNGVADRKGRTARPAAGQAADFRIRWRRPGYDQSRSKIAAMPWPPPMHMDTRP